MKYKIILWGQGILYHSHLNVIRFFEQQGAIQVVGLTAAVIPYFKRLDGYPVLAPECLDKTDYDYIIIMNDTHFDEIVKDAMRQGIPREKLLSYRVLDIPDLDFEAYIKLKESRISIVSNNCWGGIIYRSLGMECLSPFKNLFVEDEDYIKLLKDLEHYLKCPLQFAYYHEDTHSKERYPVMALDDIMVHCNHDSEPESAIEKWNRRCRKFNFEHIFVEMYTENRAIAEQFLELKRYREKICFVPYESDREDLMRLELQPGQTEFYEAVNSNAKFGRNSGAYDIVDLLNGKKSYRYMK